MSPRGKVVTRFALTALVTLALLAVLVRDFGGSGDFVAAARGARPSWVLVAFAASTACVLLTALRWQLVLRGMGHTLRFRRSLEVVLGTWPLAVVTPSRANDLLRPLAVLAEKAIDLFLLLAIAAAGAAVNGLWAWAGLVALVLLAEAVVLALLAWRRKWLERLPLLRKRPETVEELFTAMAALVRSPGALASVATTSLAIRALTIVLTHALLVSVGADVPFEQTLTLWPAAMLAGVAPVTLGGMGTRDAAFIGLLAEHGTHVPESSVLVATVGYSLVAVWSFAVIGVPFMIRETLLLRRRET
jgi:uncharacterized protein (TIRG00374 family)